MWGCVNRGGRFKVIIALHSELMWYYLDLSDIFAYIIGSTDIAIFVGTSVFRRSVAILQNIQKMTHTKKKKKKIKFLENNDYKVEKN